MTSAAVRSGPSAQPSPAVFTPAGTISGLPIELAVATGGNDQITAITHAGDDRLFLTIRAGLIKIYAGGSVLPQPFLDIRSLIGTEGEGGLLSTAFHPSYSTNGFFYVNYTNRAGDTVIARYRVSGADPNRADPASARILMTIDQPFSNHNGGQMQFGPDGFLYIGMGDGGSGGDPACRAQRDDTLLGKMLRLDVNQNVNAAPFYGIPAGNPYIGGDGVPDEIWARGLRNPWRFSFDRQTGDLWIADVGQNVREEVNFQPAGTGAGANYGWKVMEGSLCFGSDACPVSTPPCNSAAFTMPVLEYDHDNGCSITGGYVYRGANLPDLRGTYFFGDFCNGRMWGARRQGSGYEVREVSRPSGTSFDGLVTFGEDRAGELYFANGDRLFRLTGTGDTPNPTGETDGIGLYEPAAARFHLRLLDPGDTVRTLRFGAPNNPWVPLAGDWNGDGFDTPGFYDRRTATFRLKNSLSGGNADVMFPLGPRRNAWVPLAGDWDGDGRDGIGFWDPATATFRLRNTLTNGAFDAQFVFGTVGRGQRPLVGDWDGDGRDTVGLYEPGTGAFFLRNSNTGGAADVRINGPVIANGQPVGGDWNGDGRDTPGVYNFRPGVFLLLEGNAVSQQIQLGPRRSNWSALAGRW
jgi:glucose/arabinose dehydrogenase